MINHQIGKRKTSSVACSIDNPTFKGGLSHYKYYNVAANRNILHN